MITRERRVLSTANFIFTAKKEKRKRILFKTKPQHETCGHRTRAQNEEITHINNKNNTA